MNLEDLLELLEKYELVRENGSWGADTFFIRKRKDK